MKLFLSLLCTAGAVSAIKNLTSTGCADPSGFDSCQSSLEEKISACFSRAVGDAKLVCSCEDYIGNYNCYSTHCWNQVWGCDYQEYIVEYLIGCPAAKLPVPYFPAPDNAAGACSCNLGKVYNAITGAITQGASCMQSSHPIDSELGYLKDSACGCCELSGALSGIYEICPDTKPDLIGISSVSAIATELDISFDQCTAMTKINCATDLDFSLGGVSTYFPPQGFPSSGTNTLSNGDGTVTAPPSGTVFSYTNGGDKQVYTISAAQAAQGGGSAPATTTGSDGAAATGSDGGSTGTGSSGGASETGSGDSSAMSVSLNWNVLVVVSILVACSLL